MIFKSAILAVLITLGASSAFAAEKACTHKCVKVEVSKVSGPYCNLDALFCELPVGRAPEDKENLGNQDPLYQMYSCHQDGTTCTWWNKRHHVPKVQEDAVERYPTRVYVQSPQYYPRYYPSYGSYGSYRLYGGYYARYTGDQRASGWYRHCRGRANCTAR